MTLEITSPTGITKIVHADKEADVTFYKKWEERGYKVKEIKVSVMPESSCISCEG